MEGLLRNGEDANVAGGHELLAHLNFDLQLLVAEEMPRAVRVKCHDAMAPGLSPDIHLPLGDDHDVVRHDQVFLEDLQQESSDTGLTLPLVKQRGMSFGQTSAMISIGSSTERGYTPLKKLSTVCLCSLLSY